MTQTETQLAVARWSRACREAVDARSERGDQATLTSSIRPGAYVAIFSSAPPLPPDVPRTPGMTQTETQLAVARHSAGGMPGLSRGHLSRGHIRTASTRLDRASYA
jgi:hypothetical protein